MMMMVRTTALVALCLLACGSITSTALAQQGHADESSLLRSHSRQLQFEEPVLIMEGEDLMLDQHNETDHAEEDHESELVHTNETDHAAEEDDHMDEYYHDDEDHHDEDEDHDHDHDHNDTSSSSSSSAFLGSETDDDKPWGDVIVASLLINMVTLMGVFFVTGEFVAKHICKRDVAHSPVYHAFTHNIIPSFACGALLATTVFLVLPESLLLITSHFVGHEGEEGHEGHRFMEEEGGHEDHEDGAAAWRFGSCVIGGFLLPVLTSLVFPHNHEGLEHEDHDSHASPTATVEETNKLQDVPEELVVEDDDVPEEEEEEFGATATTKSQMENKASNMTNASAGSLASDDSADLVVTTEDKTLPHAIDWSLAASIMAGDFFHNFADGIFVGTAFMLCSRDLAMAISAATIYHEIAQEIADYFMFTRFCHIPPCKALCINFVNGLSVMFGACLIVGIDDITNVAIGSILGVSGGVYIYIAVAECFPRAKQAQKTLKDKLVSFLAFVIGVIPIGLVLMNHGHCEAGGDAH